MILMKIRKNKIIHLVLLLILTINISCLILSSSTAYSDSSERVILFDEAHGQFFTYTYMQSAYSILNTSADYQVRRLKGNESISSENLINVEILVISAPDKNSSNNYTASELNTIKAFVDNGGSLFLLSNPNDSAIYKEFNYTNSNYTIMNQILDTLNVLNVRFSNETIQAPAGGFFYINNRYQEVLTSTNFNSFSPISFGIEYILTFTNAIQCSDPNLIVGKTNLGSNWLVSQDFSEGGRLLVCGSMQMFSELSPYLINSTWINPSYSTIAFDNTKLWLNIFSWLSQESNTTISSTLFLLINIGAIGVCAFLIISRKWKEKDIVTEEGETQIKEEEKIETKKKDKDDLDVLINQRAKILKSARIFIKNRKYENAAEYYEKAAKLTKKIDDADKLYDTYMKKSKKYKTYNK